MLRMLNMFRPTSRRTERSLYHRANGYNYDALKIFMPAELLKRIRFLLARHW
jgi:hypothetical protein